MAESLHEVARTLESLLGVARTQCTILLSSVATHLCLYLL
jgi:hypothetical protein